LLIKTGTEIKPSQLTGTTMQQQPISWPLIQDNLGELVPENSGLETM